MPSLDLTDREATLLKNALEAFYKDFGHEQADLHRELRAIQAKLAAASDEPAPSPS